MCQIGEFKKMVQVPVNKPLTVYRRFRVRSDGSLRPLAFSYAYKPGTNRTTAPLPAGVNGFWAYYTEGALVRSKCKGRLFSYRSYRPEANINVRVKVWGRVALHTRGVRAQYVGIAPRVFVNAKKMIWTTPKNISSFHVRSTVLPTFS